jgi:hypothetical protein
MAWGKKIAINTVGGRPGLNAVIEAVVNVVTPRETGKFTGLRMGMQDCSTQTRTHDLRPRWSEGFPISVVRSLAQPIRAILLKCLLQTCQVRLK